MKFAGKRRKSTEGVTLSGAGHTGATVNGSTLWRRPDEPGAEGATYPIYFIWDIFLSVHPVSGHHPIFIARYFSVILHALDVYIERKIED